MRKFVAFAVFIILMSGMSASARADFIVNGSFETGDFTGWTASGHVFDLNFDLIPGDGNYTASFSTFDTPNDGVLSQSFGTTPGTTYRLEFDYASDSTGHDTTSMRAEVLGNSTLLDQTVTGTPPLANFHHFIFPFTADSALTTVRLSDTSTQTISIDGNLDNVSVTTADATAAPEPTSLTLLGVGAFTFLGYGCRRLKKARVRP
jgi:hypothetical protein